MGNERLIPIIAIAVLLIGSLSSVYVYAMQNDSDYIEINETEYTLDQLFFLGKQITIESNSEIFSGIALDDLMKKTGVANPESYDYTIIASDGYQKTVKWENMENGIITEEGQSIFSDLAKAFRIKDIMEIEVK